MCLIETSWLESGHEPLFVAIFLQLSHELIRMETLNDVPMSSEKLSDCLTYDDHRTSKSHTIIQIDCIKESENESFTEERTREGRQNCCCRIIETRKITCYKWKSKLSVKCFKGKLYSMSVTEKVNWEPWERVMLQRFFPCLTSSLTHSLSLSPPWFNARLVPYNMCVNYCPVLSSFSQFFETNRWTVRQIQWPVTDVHLQGKFYLGPVRISFYKESKILVRQEYIHSSSSALRAVINTSTSTRLVSLRSLLFIPSFHPCIAPYSIISRSIVTFHALITSSMMGKILCRNSLGSCINCHKGRGWAKNGMKVKR